MKSASRNRLSDRGKIASSISSDDMITSSESVSPEDHHYLASYGMVWQTSLFESMRAGRDQPSKGCIVAVLTDEGRERLERYEDDDPSG